MLGNQICAALVLIPVLSAQSKEQPVRVSIAHLQGAEQAAELPRLTPLDEALPMFALGPANRGQPRNSLLDFVAAALYQKSGRRPKVSFEGADFTASCRGLKAEPVRSTVLDGIDSLAPVVTLDVTFYGPAPSPSPVVLAPGNVSSLPKKALHTRSVRGADAQPVTFQLGDADSKSGRLRLRVQPHLLAGKRPRIALLCEFESQHRDRSGRRLWTAGAASGVVPVGGRIVLTLPGRIIAVRATHKPRPLGNRRCVGIPWSILTTKALRSIPQLGESGSTLLQHNPLRRAGQSDAMLAHVKDTAFRGQWDGVLHAQPVASRLILGRRDQKLLPKVRDEVQKALVELAKPWTETASVNCAITTTAKGSAAHVRLPTMPGRACFLLHTDSTKSETSGALIGLHWYADTRDVDAPRRLVGEGRGELVGFAVPVSGAAKATGKPTRFELDSVSKSGQTSLLRSKTVELKISRSR